jgi:hypothetical protein
MSLPTGALLDELSGVLQGLRETAHFAQQSDSRHPGNVRQIIGKRPTPYQSHIAIQFALLIGGDHRPLGVPLRYEQ